MRPVEHLPLMLVGNQMVFDAHVVVTRMNEHEHEHNTKLLSDLQVKSRLRDLEPGEHSYGTMCLNQSYAFRRFLASLSCRLTSQTLWRSKHL